MKPIREIAEEVYARIPPGSTLEYVDFAEEVAARAVAERENPTMMAQMREWNEKKNLVTGAYDITVTQR